MKPSLARFVRRYARGLAVYLRRPSRAGLLEARAVGRAGRILGLGTLALARLHETAFARLALRGLVPEMGPRAEAYFGEAILPLLAARPSTLDHQKEHQQLNRTLTRRTAELAVTRRKLERGIARRKGMEASFKLSRRQSRRLLSESLELQQGFRKLAHQVFRAQEKERTKISLKLQDEVVQTLLGINLRLLAMKTTAHHTAQGLKNDIAVTQRLVGSSRRSVRRVARKVLTA